MSVSMNTNAINKQLPFTCRRILALLKEKGKLTTEELAQFLNISTVAVRRHLNKLESDQVVAHDETKRTLGRPNYVYHLGEAADAVFPSRYEDLAITVLETIKELYGEKAIDAIFQLRSKFFIETYRPKVNGKTLNERLDQVTKLREADGYMSTWEERDDGTFLLRESNCPIIHAVKSYDCACKHELVLLSELLDAEVTRQTHLSDGDNACSYQICAK